MASLLGWLAYSGARKVDGTPVASGRAYFYTPGTSNTFATVYSDKDGLLTASSPVALDASGRAEVYTKTVVHVEVYDAAGALVRLEDRANSVNASQVEIENAAATGIDLTSGLTVAGGRTDLNSFLTSMLGSFGAPDGKVLVGGASQTLQSVLAATTGVFFNVKSVAFGARGDLTTDDSAAIQSAINAAVAAGGGTVYFPPGSYSVQSALVVNNAGVVFQGANPTSTQIGFQTTNIDTITFGGSASDFTAINIGFVTSSGKIYSGGGAKRFINCSFQHVSSSIGITISGSNVQAFVACTFLHQGTGAMFSASTTGGVLQILGGALTQSATASPGNFYGGTAGTLMFTSVNVFVTGGPTTYQLVASVAALSAVFSGCQFLPGTGNTLNLGPLSGTTPTLSENGNYINPNGSPGTVNVGVGAGISVLRETRGLRTTGSAITYTPDVLQYKWHDVTSTGASFVFANPAVIPTNASRIEIALRYKNTSGGAITPTFGTNYRIGTAPSVANNAYAAWIFEYAVSDAVWVQVGANPISITA